MLSSVILAAMLISAPAYAPAPATEIRTVHSSKVLARQARTQVIGVEMGWNSNAGIGINYTYHVHPQFSIDAGGGLGVGGKLVRLGARGRYNFLTTSFTPFVGFGMTLVPGGDLRVTGEDDHRIAVSVHTTPAMQGTVGVSWQSNGGFVAQAGAGYSYNLTVPYDTDSPTSSNEKRLLGALFGNGPSVSLLAGYAF